MPKSSLSYICKGIQMPNDYEPRLRKMALQHLKVIRPKAVARNKQIQQDRLDGIKARIMPLFGQLNDESLKIALAMLYLGEGSKWQSYRGLSLGNSDPEVITLYINLLKHCYGIPQEKMRARLQLREDQDVAELEAYWSAVTGLPTSQFYKTYKDRRTAGKPTKRCDYRGVCVIICSSTTIQLELAMLAKQLGRHMGL